MARMKNVNGVEIPLTPEEETQRDAEEQAWTDGAAAREMNWIRDHRNDLLTETDWIGTTDVTMSDEWKTYRQALRDLPSGKDTVSKCENATYPTKP